MTPNFLEASIRISKRISQILLLILVFVMAFPPVTEAAGALTSVKDTLSTSRPSVKTAITGTITGGDTTINVASTNAIQPGDTITLKDGATTETKIVSGILSATKIALTVGTTSGYSTSGFVYFKATSKHTITFTTRSAVTAGKFVVTLPGDVGGVNDGLPGASGFDFGGITAGDISVSGFTAATTATSSPSSNVVVTFTFSGTVAASTAITLNIGNTNNFINPTKTAADGTADTSTVQIDEQDGSNNVVDTSKANVATIESVGVSATVAPSLAFTINSVSSGTAVTGYNTDITSTATSVPFGTLSINATTTIAQFLNVATNSNSGYAVTVQQDGSLRKTNGATIVDFDASTTQNNESTTGFGYSLANKVGTDAAFLYNGSGTFNGRGFSSTTPFTIMSNAGPVNGNQVYVAYRVKVNATQAQGDYKNLITYIATATY